MAFFRLVWSSPGYVISLRSGKKPRSLCELETKRTTISRSPSRGLTRLAIDGEHNTPMMKSEARTTLTRWRWMRRASFVDA
ncbi:unnamed protein product [Trichogramma brassicae]|uniref:Uncharacterized protein n=1 Tax=Trichogramma brassicae TaxID=86971 RepID=A0A6H5IDT0_9HYME|nr:unnamed protein product [Trichogramma brassicae]